MNKKSIDQADYEIIESIAKKYDMSVKELAKSLLAKNGRYSIPQILLTSDERSIIDQRANQFNYSRSFYCLMCWKKAVKEGLYKNIDIAKLQERRYGENSRKTVAIYFKDEDDYNELKDITEKLGVSVSSLIRYFALTVEL
ncbi:MAG: hypothetical protein K2H41_15455 [Acetatifactor sp.]|nr:hypothetical protein [Acetatifactor sp.]